MKKSATIKQVYDELQQAVHWTIQVLRRRYVDALQEKRGRGAIKEWIELDKEMDYGDSAVLKISVHSRDKSCMLYADGFKMVVDWHDLSIEHTIHVIDGLEILLNDLTGE